MYDGFQNVNSRIIEELIYLFSHFYSIGILPSIKFQ
jgi:hypothetical protein